MKNRNSHGQESTAETSSNFLLNFDLGNSTWRLRETQLGVRFGALSDKICRFSCGGGFSRGTHPQMLFLDCCSGAAAMPVV